VHDIATAAPPAQAAPPDASPGAAPPPPQPSVEPFHFTGKAGEYFGIWIVNLFLTIVTLGVYSAWAKVRKQRYFYGNTWMAGANFDYHGNPVAILKGRLLAFAAFAAYTLAGYYSPRTAAAIAVIFMPAVPWLLVRSFAFNAINSSYRNLRFHFRATYREGLVATWPLLIIPVLVLVLPQVEPNAPPKEVSGALIFSMFLPPLVLALFYPLVVARVNRLRIDHGRYGSAPFATSSRTIQFYGIYGIAAILILGAVLAMGLLAGALFGFFAQSMEAASGLALWLLPVVYLVAFAVIFAFTRSRVANLVFNCTRLAERVRFRSRLRARALARIYITNAIAIVASLGLLIPWAAIRTARYRAECLQLECEGGLESFAADVAAHVAAHVAATGEEMGDMFDVDLSL
jgi:uncharacterized membrane protein YjgN (DUF898 family)